MNRTELEVFLNSLSLLTGISLRTLDAAGNTINHYGEQCSTCVYYRTHLATESECRELSRIAAMRARDIAETYIFSCPIGLCNAVRAIPEQDEITAVMAGPFLLEEPDTLFIQELAEKYNAPLSVILDIYEKAQTVKVLAPAEATALSRIMNMLFHNEDDGDALRQKINMQQRRIGESIQAYKGFSGGVPAYPFEKEQALIQYVEEGSQRDANRILNELLGYALFSTGSDIEMVKSWAAELCALLSRTAGHNGKSDAFHLNHSFMRRLWETDSIETLALLLQETVERFCQSVFPTSIKGDKAAVSRTMRYVELHYAEDITLNSAAQNVYLTPSYLSSLFKKVLGFSFNEYINTVRINEAKRRLKQGYDSITEIAYAVGYESQSYFSKVFHRLTGMSPSEYQRQHSKNQNTAE